MNHTYRLVWNEAAQREVPAAEAARCRVKSGGCRALKPLRAIILAAAFGGTYAGSAYAAPTGGTVVAGQGTISQSGGTTTVRQQSQNLSLNWLGFSIAPAETVQFVQPSTTAIALNRVIGTDASQIYGHLAANGQVFLINPNGVLFAPSAQVDVGSLVASTLNISNADFLAGNYKFQTGSSNSAGSASPASVINQGSITAAAGGSVALLGGQVSNQGTITAQLGTVALAAGSAMTLDFRGNKLMSVQVDRSAVGALAENRQLIQADGGTVIMTAAARDALLNTVVNNTGVIEARTIQNQDGEIKLLGSPEGGRVNVDGTLDASAPNGGNGGSIETSGAHVEIADSAHITTAAANGKTGIWLVDPTDFTIAPTGGDISGATLDGELASTGITLATSSSGSGNGDIFVNDAVSWGASTTLTLTAARNIQINSTINASGNTAGLALNYGSGGNYYVNTGGKVTLSGTNPSFSVNGQAYTVINSLGVQGDTTSTTLQGIQNTLSGFYVLGTDIDASATSGWNNVGGTPWGFVPLGNPSTPFTGVFDGLNHTITGLTINRPRSYVGLFGDTSGAIRDVGLVGGSVTGQVNVGALAGYNTGVIYNSYATTNVSSTSSQAGGLVGETDGGSISNSYATGNVSGANYVGGLVGYMPVGGAISDSYASGNVTSTGFDAGGLVGYMSTNSFSYPSITNSYATGTVAGNTAVGGLVGALVNGSIANGYSTGAVTGTANLGGMVGTSASGTTITNSFWNITTSGLGASSGGTGMTTAQMQALANFTSATAGNGNVNPNWDFTSVWRIYDGYTAPLLKALLTPLTVTADNISATYNGSTSNAALTNPVYSVAGAGASVHLQGVANPYSNDRNTGTYAPILWSDQQGYDVTVKNSTLTITPATLTITAASNTKTYDGTVTAAATPTFSGLQTGDTVTGLTEAYADKNAGTGKTLAVASGYTISDSNGGNNYTVSTVNNTSGEIDKATLTLTAVSNTKPYDGTFTAAATPTSGGLQTGDSITGLTEVYADKNAGTGKTLIVSGFKSLTDSNGSDSSNNYTVDVVDNATGVINKANLTITASSNIKTYDGTTAAGAMVAATGNVTGDTVSAIEAYASKNVMGTNGSTLQVTHYSVTDAGGADMSGNYNVNTTTAAGTIGPASITVSSSNVTKIYDGTTAAAGSAIVSGGTQLFGTDSLSGGTFAFTDKNAGTGDKTVTTSGVTVSDGNSGGNYTVTYANNTTSTINPAALALTTSNVTKTYDGTTSAAGSAIVSGGTQLFGTDSLSGGTFAFTDKNAGTGDKTVTTSGVTVSDGNSGGNYTVTYANNTTSTINPAALALTTSNVTKTYDGTTSAAGSAIVSGGTQLFGTDSLSGGTFAFTDKNAGTGDKTVTTSGVTVSDGNSGGNYTVTYANNTTSTINPAALTVSSSNVTKTYNGTTSAAGSAIVSGGTQLFGTDSLSGGTFAFIDKNAGTGDKTVTTSGVTVSDGNSGGNYTVTYANNTTSTINPAALALTTSNVTKTYDGTTAAAGSAIVSGGTQLFGTDSLSGGTFAFTDKNAGTGDKTVTTSGVTVSDGNSGGNYTVTYANNTTSTINPAALALTTSNVTKTYDGTTAAGGSAIVSGGTQLFGTDSLSGGTFAFTDKNAGTGDKTVTTSGVTVSDGNSGGNYTVTYANNTTSTINQAALTLTTSNVTKTYNGTTSAAGSAIVSGGTQLFGTDSLSGGTFAFTDKNAGTGDKTVTTSGVTVSDGNSGGNYTVTYANNTTSTINPAALALTTSNVTKTYDGTTAAAGSAIVSGGTQLFGTDSLSGGTFAFTDKNAGTGDKTVTTSGVTVSDGNSGGNYTVTYANNTTSTINPAALALTTSNVTKTYDGTTSAAGSAIVSGGTQLFGTDSLSGGTFAFTDKNAGTGDKTVTTSGVTVSDGNGGGNYTVTYANNTTSTINKANLTLTATTNTKTYDGTAAAGAVVTPAGNVAGDTVTASEAYISKNVMGTNGSTLQVAHYSVTDAGGADMSGNYNITTTTAAGTINPATLTVSGATAASKTYDGSVDATISGGLLNSVFSGDSVGLLQTGLFSDRNAGTNKTVTENFGLTGSDSGNYTLAHGTGQTTASITPKTLTVIANAQTKTYGQADPTLSYASSGYVSGTFNGVTVNDTAASVLTGTLTRAAGEAVHGGPYAIRQGSLASNSNYAISYTSDFLTIIPATITLSGITAIDKPYDATTTATLNTGAASLVGRIGSDSLGVTATGDFVNASAGTGKTVALSNLTLTGAASGNYVLAGSGNESSTTASITPDNLTITADNATKVAGATNPALTLTYSGFVAGERAASLTTPPTVSTTAGTTSPAGSYSITASGAIDPNYAFTYVPGTLTVRGNASTSSPGYTGVLANLSNEGANGTSGSGSGVGEGEAHGAALDCSEYVHCVEIPGNLADNDGEDVRGRSRGALSLWSLIILDGGIRLPMDVR